MELKDLEAERESGLHVQSPELDLRFTKVASKLY